MLKILVRLYLITIVSYAGAIFLIPELILSVFHERYEAYNLQQAQGVQRLMLKQFQHVPSPQWPEVAQALAADFAPLEVELRRQDETELSPAERARLGAGSLSSGWANGATTAPPLPLGRPVAG